MFPKEQRVVDKAYRKSRIHGACENCGAPSPIGAHPRAGQTGGAGLKPDDRLLLFLCNACHLTGENPQETGGFLWLARFLYERIMKLPWPAPTEDEAAFVVTTILYPLLRRRYGRWLIERK